MILINFQKGPRRRRILRIRLHLYPFGAGLGGCQWASPGRFRGEGRANRGGRLRRRRSSTARPPRWRGYGPLHGAEREALNRTSGVENGGRTARGASSPVSG